MNQKPSDFVTTYFFASAAVGFVLLALCFAVLLSGCPAPSEGTAGVSAEDARSKPPPACALVSRGVERCVFPEAVCFVARDVTHYNEPVGISCIPRESFKAPEL